MLIALGTLVLTGGVIAAVVVAPLALDAPRTQPWAVGSLLAVLLLAYRWSLGQAAALMAYRAETIVDHLAHIVEVVGDDFASLGSDWDGAIVPPRDLPTCLELPRLVECMLGRGWSSERIQKILGGNFLRALATLRG